MLPYWPNILPYILEQTLRVIFVIHTGLANKEDRNHRGTGPSHKQAQKWFSYWPETQPYIMEPKPIIIFVIYTGPANKKDKNQRRTGPTKPLPST